MIDQLIHRIKLRQSELKESLAVGIPTSWDAYRLMVGEYQGLQRSLDFIDSMLEEDRRDENSK